MHGIAKGLWCSVRAILFWSKTCTCTQILHSRTIAFSDGGQGFRTINFLFLNDWVPDFLMR